MIERSPLKQALGYREEDPMFESQWRQFTTLKLECIQKQIFSCLFISAGLERVEVFETQYFFVIQVLYCKELRKSLSLL